MKTNITAMNVQIKNTHICYTCNKYKNFLFLVDLRYSEQGFSYFPWMNLIIYPSWYTKLHEGYDMFGTTKYANDANQLKSITSLLQFLNHDYFKCFILCLMGYNFKQSRIFNTYSLLLLPTLHLFIVYWIIVILCVQRNAGY